MATLENLENEENEETTQGAGGWNELAAQQRANRETEAMAVNQRLFDGFANIEAGSKMRQAAASQQRAIAGAAMMESAFRNGGMSDRSLSQAFSQAFGMPVFGGQLVNLGKGKGLSFVMYGAAKDPQTGKATIAPIAMMDGVQMSQTLQKAKLGDRTADLQKAIYGDLSSRFTTDQLGKMGVQSPTAPVSTGGAVISAAGMRALRGEPRPRSTISVFSNIGGDGYAGTGTRSATIRPDGTREEATTGTRDPNYQGKWTVLSSGPEGDGLTRDENGKVVNNPNARQITRYRNDKTGEVVEVPQGDTLRNVLQRGGSERERIAQMNNDSREKRAKIAAEATTYKANAAKEIAEMKAKGADGLNADQLNALGKIVNNSLADEELRSAATQLLIDEINRKRGGGKGGTAQPKKGGDSSAQGGEKKITGYRYNKDRSKRIPVYSDGTQGEVEDAK